MRNFFIPQEIFNLRSEQTGFSNLPENRRLVGTMHMEGRYGYVVDERQFGLLYPDGTEGYSIVPSQIHGLLLVMEAEVPTPEPIAAPTRGRRTAATQTDLDLAAPDAVLTAGAQLRKTWEQLFSQFGDLEPLVLADAPFDRCTPRTSGTGTRLILTLPLVDGYTPARVNTNNVQSVRPYEGHIYSPSGRGICLFESHPHSPVYCIPIAELFATPEGGLDVFVLLDSGFSQSILQARRPPTRGTRGPEDFLRIVLNNLRIYQADQARLQQPRAERFAASLDAFVRFGAQAQHLVHRQAEQDIQQALTHKHDLTRRFQQFSMLAQQQAQPIPALRAELVTYEAHYRDQIQRLLSHPKAILVETDGQRTIIITTSDLQATHPETGEMIPVGLYKVALDLVYACVDFTMVSGPGHPYLRDTQGGHDTTSIDAAIAEAMAKGEVFAAWRIALRFLQTLDAAHPWTPKPKMAVTAGSKMAHAAA